MPAGIGYPSKQGGMQPGRPPPLRLPGGSSRPPGGSPFGQRPTAPGAPSFTFGAQGQHQVNVPALRQATARPPRVRAHFPFTQQPYRDMRELPQMQQFMKQQYYANAGGRGPGVSRQSALSMGSSPSQALAAPGASRSVSSRGYPGVESLLRRRRGEVPPSVYAALLARGQQRRMLEMLR